MARIKTKVIRFTQGCSAEKRGVGTPFPHQI